MIHLNSDQNILYMVVSEKLTNDDFDKIAPLVRSKIKQFGKIRLYYEMSNYKGWTIKAFFRDLYMDLKYRNNVEKIAMIGEKYWEKWMADAIKPFSGAEVRFYAPHNKEEARMWINK